MAAVADAPVSEAIRFGPTGAPDRSLAEQIAAWCWDYLRLPDGPDAGDPWVFTDEQYRFLAWWYAHDEQGRWLYRRATLRRMKGWGKDPLGAVLCAVEAFGPCRVGPGGRAIRHPAGWVQVVAVSRDQTRTTMRLFPGLIPESTREELRVDVHKEIVHIDGGRSVIEAITSSPHSAEGPRSTFVLRNEIQNWLASNEGHEMADVIDGNLAKSRDGSARALSLCNAHVPGLDSVGEREWDAFQAIEQGRSRATGVLYDSLEAPPDTSLVEEESLRRGLELARGDAIWLDVDRLIGEIWDPRTPASESRRKYLNQLVAAEDAWVAPHEWDVLADRSLRLEEGEQIALGFDGGKSDDHCALVAVRIDTGDAHVLDVWDPERYGGEAPRDQIDGAVEQAFERFDVVAFYSDLAEWESYVDRWAEAHARTLCARATPKNAVAWDMRRSKESTRAAEWLHDEIVEQAFRYDADPRLRQHVLNARRRINPHGVTFGKEHRESKRKVDALAALMLARVARRDYLALPRQRQRRRRRGRAVFV